MKIYQPSRATLSRCGAALTGLQWRWATRCIAAIILLSWLWAALHDQLWFALAFLSILVAVGWVVRFRRDILASIVTVLLTAAILALLVIRAVNSQAPGADAVAAVLTGHIIAAPVPTLVAWTLRPTLISRSVNSVIGSTILVLAAAPVVVWSDHGYGTAILIAALVTSCSVVVCRHRRAWARRTVDLPVTADGWTDLGRRIVPSGTTRLFVGHGHALTALTVSVEPITPRLLHRAMQHSVDAAAAIGLPACRVQPVVITLHEHAELGARAVSTSRGAATVLIASPGQIPSIQSLAPCRRWGAHRRALYAAAALPSVEEGTR